jgi:hypothetical protein
MGTGLYAFVFSRPPTPCMPTMYHRTTEKRGDPGEIQIFLLNAEFVIFRHLFDMGETILRVKRFFLYVQ